MNGEPITLLEKPKVEHVVNVGKGIRGVRFDVVAETQDYHIFCIDSQRVFKKEEYSNRTLYYGCMAMASKSLREKEAFDQLRPVTVIFIYIDNDVSKESVDVIGLYKKRDVEGTVTPQPYNDKLTFIDINLNNKANHSFNNVLDADLRAFMDLMSVGDDEYLVERILSDENISDSMRNVIGLLSNLMNDVIRNTPPTKEAEKQVDDLSEILRKDEFKMTTRELIKDEGRVEGMIKVYYEKMNLQPSEIAKELEMEESEVIRILKELRLFS
jgi:hypothetical protein